MAWRNHDNIHSTSLRWRHNDHDGVANHQPHGYLLNRLFRRRSKKTSKFRVTGLCVGNSPGPVNSPHKGPVTRKMFPFDDVIMMRDTLHFIARRFREANLQIVLGHMCRETEADMSLDPKSSFLETGLETTGECVILWESPSLESNTGTIF